MKNFFQQLFAKLKELFVTKKYLVLTIAIVLILGISAVILVTCLGGGGDQPTSSGSAPDSSNSGPDVETTCIVTFESNGGTTVNALEVETGATIDLSQYMTSKEGSYFYGWCLDAECTERATVTLEVNADVTLYAEWGTEEKYLLSFETFAGSKIESVLYSPKAYLVAPEDPTLENYTFGGWYKDEACTKEFTFYAAQMPKKNLTVYAKWNTMHAIHFNSNGGSEVASLTGEAGEPVVAPTAPTKDGYVFEGWFEDEALTTPYDIQVIPNKVVTVYAKWHEQMKDIQVTLHLNYGEMTETVVLTGNENEAIADADTVAQFIAKVNASLQDQYLGDASALTEKPVYNLSAWAYDTNGSRRFEGKLPHQEKVDLYAVWTRSAAYCEVTFVNNDAFVSYFVNKNTAIDAEVLEEYTASAKAEYEELGCIVEGFYTLGGNRYVEGDMVAMDMKLMPYIYSANLAYEYATFTTPLGATVKGYALKGYQPEVAEEYKNKENLLLIIPEYYNDGTHGQLSVVWIADNAFANYPVSSVTLPDSLLGIGVQAFMNTKLTEISLSTSLYSLGDNAFSGSTDLATVTFKNGLSWLGATVFKDTAYETTMTRNSSGFIFFDSGKTIIYGYEGTAKTVTTPSEATVIAGGAFKDNATVTKLTLHDNVRYVSDYAFENSALTEVTIGKFFTEMGTGIFQNCASLKTVKFTSAYNLSYIGVSMFEGCSSLQEINITNLANLKELKARAFYGCSSMANMKFGDNFLQVGASAFENCTSLVYVEFGASDLAQFNKISDRTFAGCTSLKRVILRGELINDQPVSFGKEVFDNAGYIKNGSFVTPVLYVKENTPDFSDMSNWKDDTVMYTYVQIYQMRFAGTEYKDILVKAIDAKAPEVTVMGTITLNAKDGANFDILSFMTENGMYSYTDDISRAEDCTVYIKSVIRLPGGTMLTGSNGKYNLTTAGTYQAILVVEDEFGNVTEKQVNIIVNANA